MLRQAATLLSLQFVLAKPQLLKSCRKRLHLRTGCPSPLPRELPHPGVSSRQVTCKGVCLLDTSYLSEGRELEGRISRNGGVRGGGGTGREGWGGVGPPCAHSPCPPSPPPP